MHFIDISTELRNTLSEGPCVTPVQQLSTKYSHLDESLGYLQLYCEKLLDLLTGLKSEFATENGIVNIFLNTLYCPEDLKYITTFS